jgi:sigma-E factor negative regulatory protein RseC
MIEEQALVVKVDEETVLLQASRSSACGRCTAKSSCGQTAIAQWAASKMVNIKVTKPLHIQVSAGDTVIVGIEELSFIKASLLLYLTPLVFMSSAGFLITQFGYPEWMVIIASFSVLIASFFVVKLFSNRLSEDTNYQLHLLYVVN